MATGDRTAVLVVDTAQFYSVITQSNCKQVQVVEQGGGATQSFQVKEPASASTAVQYSPGSAHVFTAPAGATFASGTTVGSVKATNGSITFAITEKG
jgi:hypothetical protein